MAQALINNKEPHSKHPKSHKLLLAGGIAAASATLLPYILPAIGIGDDDVLIRAENLLHSGTEIYGSGLAGTLNGAIAKIPLIGASLATGTIAPILASAAVGIGGVLIANWLEKHENGATSIKWSKVIRTVSLATSALIALPSILTGITTGLSYAALAMGDNGSIVGELYGSLGVAGGHISNASLFGAAIPHLLLCGMSILPTGLAAWMGAKKGTPDTNITPGHGPDTHARLMPRSAAEIYSAI